MATLEEIQAKETELDAIDEEIKTKIMGWIPEPAVSGSLEIPGVKNYYEYKDGKNYEHRDGMRYEVNDQARLFSPTTYIDDAWKVVEKMRQDGYDVDVTARPKLEYGCRIAPRGEFNTPLVVFEAAETAPLAICRAALKAVSQ